MREFIKKSASVGLGLAFVTKEKAEEAARKINDEVRIGKDEGKKVIGDLLKKSEEAKKNLDKFIDGAVHSAIKKLDIPTRTEMKNLEERIRDLEKREKGGEESKAV